MRSAVPCPPMASAVHVNPSTDRSGVAPMGAILLLTAVCSLGTGILWNGLAFIVKHDYGYSQRRTLVLYVFIAFVYIVAAFITGRVLIMLRRHISPRTVLACLLAVQTLASAGPGLAKGEWMIWITASVVSITGAMIWPIVESYLAAGRHGRELRASIGWWNVVWTAAVAAALLLMAPLVEHHARFAIVGFSAVNLLGFWPLVRFPSRPGAHDHLDAEGNITSEYPHLLKAARVLLPLSYVLNAGMSPLLPFVFETMGVQAKFETPTAATWTVARVIAVAVMWRVTFWHGRWGTLLMGAVSLAGGFACVVSASHLWMIFLGLAIFGTGMGVVYYAALYYALTVGRAEVDAGGIHEALIGGGYMLGPMICLGSMHVATTARENEFDVADGSVIIVAMWTVVAASALLMVNAYLRAKRARRASKSI